MSSVFQYLQSRFYSNNDSNYNNTNANAAFNNVTSINTGNGGNTESSSRVVSLDITSIASDYNDDDDDNDNEEEEEEVSNTEMAYYFQSFRNKKTSSMDLTFRICRMQASDIQQQAGITQDDPKKRRTRSEEVPLIYNKKRQTTKTEPELESKPVDYDDKWLRILKGINRRNFNTGRKYRHVEERIWNNSTIHHSTTIELPTVD
ncbi:hypothetical protein, no similarity [Maudiozyma saulgeensis]|uniref:Uncharacterized protein n=1 Tax=Maudiozyma saulgeensis TaxID=1789683 RepID=A0A1X7R1B4_9SACH|nr:hypothetical protein, no similarity [Kazachstania saulgeensis]